MNTTDTLNKPTSLLLWNNIILTPDLEQAMVDVSSTISPDTNHSGSQQDQLPKKVRR
jgi:hypothetical protein